jgi:hypothetical protein
MKLHVIRRLLKPSGGGNNQERGLPLPLPMLLLTLITIAAAIATATATISWTTTKFATAAVTDNPCDAIPLHLVSATVIIALYCTIIRD